MAVVIRDSFDPGTPAQQVDVRDMSESMLRQLALSGSREAAQELARRLGRR